MRQTTEISEWRREVFEGAHSGSVPLVFATPGAERQDSVYNGFQVRALGPKQRRTKRVLVCSIVSACLKGTAIPYIYILYLYPILVVHGYKYRDAEGFRWRWHLLSAPPREGAPVFSIVTGEPFKQSAELTGEPIKMKG